MHLKLRRRTLWKRVAEMGVVLSALVLSLFIAKHGIDETARGVRGEISDALPAAVSDNIPLFDSGPPPDPVYPGPESLAKSIPVRNAEQLRADLRNSQRIADSADLDLTDTIILTPGAMALHRIALRPY